ncbi:F-box/kelch-repeat protein [Trifolium repens]|nr:F-box/kelch-repeat protein [Trifolium repens]
MALVSNKQNKVLCSPSLTQETIGTLTSLSNLPVYLIPEILSRLPVKPLLQLRCVCKSWKSLISDPIFAKKHLALSTRYSLHDICFPPKYVLKSYSLDSVLTNVAQIEIPSNHYGYFSYFFGSCNGILCLAVDGPDFLLVRLWNPSIRKFKELPPISEPNNFDTWMYGFGYDSTSDNYKVVAVLHPYGVVKVHTLGTDSWRSVSVFPFTGVYVQESGQYVSGTINWLVYMENQQGQCFIASLDLGNESYQKVLLPDYGEEDRYTELTVFRNCLCMISREDVWVMKEFGNKESWTKLFTISYVPDPCTSSYSNFQTKYVFENDQVLLICKGDDQRWKYISYNRKKNTSKIIEFQNTLEICVESLISSCF